MRAYVGIMAAGALVLGACAGDHEQRLAGGAAAPEPSGEEVTISAVERPAFLSVAGTAEPLRQATLSTKLMGSVTVVEANAGDLVRTGQVLVRIDARDLAARTAQLEAALSEAEAVQKEAELHARRMQALFDEEAAPRAQVDAAETGLARARAAVESVRASSLELAATRDYSVVRAPFDGIVVARMVDPGSFAAPGAPLLVVQDASVLRVSVTAAPSAVRGLARGQRLLATIEGEPVEAEVEGVVPAGAGSMYTVNALVRNDGMRLLARGAATLALPSSVRTTFVVPARAVVRESDMTGLYLRRDGRTLLRWVRVGPAAGDSLEVLAGIRDGDVIVVPAGR